MVADLIGYPQLDWQRDVTATWSAFGDDGKWVHHRCGASVPRQAGKSIDGIIWTVFLASLMGYAVLWTDHNYSTTMEMLARFRRVYGWPTEKGAGIKVFRDQVSRYNTKTAQEAIELKNGGVIAFATRTKSASLGYSFDAVVYDEAQELTGEQMQAIIPTTSSARHHNTQSIFLGTPTRAGSTATKFRDMRDEALSDEPPDDLCWHEWGVEEVGDIFDEPRWYRANPSLGPGRADIDAIRAGIRALGRGDELAAAQEYLGYWLPQKTAAAAIPKAEWDACAVAAFPQPDPAIETVCYGVKYSPDGKRLALAACCIRRGMPPHVELVLEADAHRGTPRVAALVDEARRRVSEVLVDGKTGAAALVDALKGRKVPRSMYRVATAADVVDAASILATAVANGDVTHLAHKGQELLDESATESPKRKVGRDGWGFDGEGCHVVEAASLALLCAKTAKRRPTRRMRVG